MTSFVFISAKGSPGVTTTTAALAAAAAGSSAGKAGSTRSSGLVVELDPAGGDLASWCGPLGEPGLVALASAGHGLPPTELLRRHAVEAVPGVWAVVAPTTPQAMAATLRSPGMEHVVEGVRAWTGSVFVDAGRVLAAGRDEATDDLPPAMRAVVARADRLVVVCRPTLTSIEHARTLVRALAGTVVGAGDVACVVVGGERPYRRGEIEAALGVPVIGVLPWDARGVQGLWERGAGRAWRRTPLAVAAGRCAAHLAADVTRPPAAQGIAGLLGVRSRG